MGFKEYLTVISRRWHVFLPIVAMVIGAHVLWVTFGQQQGQYRASSMVMISSPLLSANGVLAKAPIPLGRVESFSERPVLETAVQLLTGKRSFGSKEFEEPARRDLIDRIASSVPSPARLQREIENSMTVTLSKDDRVATIESSTKSPERALVFSWALAEAARQFNNERCSQIIERTAVELKGQRERLEKEKDLVLRDRTEFAKRTGFTNFPRYQEMVQTIILGLEGEISQIRGQQREIERTIDERVSKSQQGGEEIQAVAADLGGNPRLKELSEQLLKARLDYDLNTSRLTDRHPTVATLKVKVERLERLISDEQESMVSDGLKKWNGATRDLVKQSGALALKLEVLKERKTSMSREMLRLAEVSQEYSRIEEQAVRVTAGVGRVDSQISELEWAGIQAMGQVQIHNLASEAQIKEKLGSGYGPIVLTLLLALFFAVGVVYALEYIDTRVKTEHDVRRYLGLPLLGMIPNDRNSLLCDEGVSGEVVERFNTAATLIRSTARELGMKSLMVTSALPEEGKTTVSVNLAIALARKGVRVVLVDGDLRNPKIHDVLNLPNKVGLTTALESQIDPRRVIDGILSKTRDGEAGLGVSEALISTDIEGLSVLTSGPETENPVQLLESDRMHRLLKELGNVADFVIFDTPPVNKVGDALTIAGLVDGSIYVVGAGLCEHHDVAWAKHLLANVQANLLGVFLNRYAQRSGSSSYYYGYSRSKAESRKHATATV